MRKYRYAVRVARADPLEALSGHYCGPTCIHYDMMPTHERDRWKQKNGWGEWPSEVMERYTAR